MRDQRLEVVHHNQELHSREEHHNQKHRSLQHHIQLHHQLQPPLKLLLHSPLHQDRLEKCLINIRSKLSIPGGGYGPDGGG